MKTLILTSAFLIFSLVHCSCGVGGPGASAAATSAPASAPAVAADPLAVPNGLGVNIFFCNPRPGEMEMITGGGFRIVRMDFKWRTIEKVQGQYDFSAYDGLLAALDKHNVRALLILDYGNKLYEDDNCIRAEAGRKAFAAWAIAGVKRFKGRGVLWEMWNEPNIEQFWKPKPNVQEYIQLAMEVGKALRKEAPDEQFIGPAVGTMNFQFLKACFKAGLLEYWSAVSVHPYRKTGPETAAADYARLRGLIDQYAPKGKRIPIICSEWGYPSAGGSWLGTFNKEDQGKLLPRQWLTNLASGIPVSIWYAWFDSTAIPTYGMVHNYDQKRDPAYEPKPAYLAAKTLTTALAGFRFNQRLSVGGPGDYVLEFTRGEERRLAVWTTSKIPHPLQVPAKAGKYAVTGHTGQPLPELTSDGQNVTVTATDAPQYLTPQAPR